MEVRKIHPEERLAASKIQTIAFTTGQDFSSAETDPERYKKGYETCRAAFNEEGKMCACFELLPYEVRFDGSIVKMAGIGGVASLPEERNRGYVREIFRQSFEEMRENKQWFSFLYPFSHPYYRKFGYESGYKRARTTVPMSSFRHFPNNGQVKQYLPGTENCHIRNIYNKFISDKNLAVVRSDYSWSSHIGQDPYKNSIYTYVWYNSSGEARSYITFKSQQKREYVNEIGVQELIWLDAESLLGILGFLNTFVPRYESFSWDAPGYLDLKLLFPEPYNVSTEINSYGMNRIVDLKEVLKLAAWPGEEGKLTFEVNDNFLEWNNGTFVVNWRRNGVEVEKKDCAPDISCSIQVLTQLLTGLNDLEDFFASKDVKVHANHELLSRLFKKKKLFINDYF